jgi:hypothetical protein
MQAIDVILKGDGAWPDLEELNELGRFTHLSDAVPDWRLQIAALPSGMESGRTSVAMRIDMPNGEVVLVETSLRLLSNAVDILKASYSV